MPGAVRARKQGRDARPAAFRAGQGLKASRIQTLDRKRAFIIYEYCIQFRQMNANEAWRNKSYIQISVLLSPRN